LITRFLAFSFLGLLLLGCQGDDSVGFTGSTRVLGQARVPVDGSSDSGLVALRNAPITVVDRLVLGQVTARAQLRETVVGMTDENGNYDVTLEPQQVAAIVINGEIDGAPIRVSGLVNATRDTVAKNFDTVTDVACQAGLDAIVDGTIPPSQFDEQFVGQLETAAAEFLSNNVVNFLDPNSVTNAANSVRAELGVSPGASSSGDTSSSG